MKASKTILPNGVRVITVSKRDATAATALVLAETGSKYETVKTSGLSHFLEHMLFKGTPTRPTALDISSELDSLGAQSNAFTSHEYTGYYATVWPKHLPQALDVIADVYKNSLFDPNEIEKEKGVIIEEINMYEDNPGRHVGMMFMELVYGDQPAGWSILGPKERIQSYTQKDFLKYRSRHYVAPATTVVFAGDVDPKKMLALARKQFGDLPKAPKAGKAKIKDKQSKPNLSVEYRELDQSHMIFGFRALPLGHPKAHVADLLAILLGGTMSSRLYQKIREEMGAAYYVRSNNDTYTDHGLVEIAVGADSSRATQVAQAVLDECRRLLAEPIPAKELQMVKDYIIGNLYLELETSGQTALYYGYQETVRHHFLTPEEYAEKIAGVTEKELVNLARTFFKSSGLNLAVLGPYRSGAEFARVLRI